MSVSFFAIDDSDLIWHRWHLRLFDGSPLTMRTSRTSGILKNMSTCFLLPLHPGHKSSWDFSSPFHFFLRKLDQVWEASCKLYVIGYIFKSETFFLVKTVFFFLGCHPSEASRGVWSLNAKDHTLISPSAALLPAGHPAFFPTLLLSSPTPHQLQWGHTGSVWLPLLPSLSSIFYFLCKTRSVAAPVLPWQWCCCAPPVDLSSKLWKKKIIMASKKQEGDGRREKKRKKIKQGIVLRRGERRKKQGKTLKMHSRWHHCLSHRGHWLGRQRPFTVLRPARQGPGSHRSRPECLFCWETVDCFWRPA